MYSFISELLCDKKGGETFVLFGGWHFFYIVLTILTLFLLCFILRDKDIAMRAKCAKMLSSVAFGLYVADFFLMPLAYGEIDIEKLPFHACTAMCVMSFLSQHNKYFEKYKTSFALLGFISNLVYLIYPAGVMWHSVHPISYRVIQTLVFHSIMTVYGFLVLAYSNEKTNGRIILKHFSVVVMMTVWALLGNYTYNGTNGDYSHFFNWFFVVRDPFNALPEAISPYIMPFLNIILFFAVELLVLFIISLFGKRKNYERTKKPL